MKNKEREKLEAVFYREGITEPVRDWLKNLPRDEKKVLGEDIKTVQYGWPIGMPLVKSLGGGLWEIRANLPTRIARVIFVMLDGKMVLLHAFIKKMQQTPLPDIKLAQERARKVKHGK